MMDFSRYRKQFPALQQEINGNKIIRFDNAAGTQVPQIVIDRITDYLSNYNANTEGMFEASIRSDEMLRQVHEALADFLNARSYREIVMGQNMTSLTQMLSRSLGREFREGDEIIVTRMDHDANVSPWLDLRERGVAIRFADINPDDVTLDWSSFKSQLSSKTKLVAVTYASNAFGTINDVAEVVRQAHAHGALCLIDAVHYAPHGPIDVQKLDCDFLVCSGYKYFGPHTGILYGKEEQLNKLYAYKVRPQHDDLPDRFEWGTLNHEGLAGLLGAIEYLERIGHDAEEYHADDFKEYSGRRRALKIAMSSIRDYEITLTEHLLNELKGLENVTIYGITDPRRLTDRVPTFAVTVRGKTPREAAGLIAKEGICVWDGNYYALEPMVRLGLEERGGAIRISLVHYNTHEEIDRLIAAMRKL
ncbi:MAG TPA: cysteine desulfurase-like protein [Blastocatellia bacterium]|nr:cysteine desulfurase-like protein [Blastocatellia bacterium]